MADPADRFLGLTITLLKDRNMIGQFIALLFLARDLAHREHFAIEGPGSYAGHKGLEEFYTKILPLADKLAEAYMGRTRQRIRDLPLLENEYQGTIAEILYQQREWLEANRYKVRPKEDTPIQNIIDEIIVQYLSTDYQLTLK